MAGYLLIASRDPFESNDVQYYYDLARGLLQQGERVTLFLVQNGVLPARRGARAPKLGQLIKDGAEVLADEFSLRERGISGGRLSAGIRPASLDVIIERLAAGDKVLWH